MEASTETPAATAAPASLKVVPLALLKEHPLNPRKRFDPAKLAEPAESVKAMGILNPLLVRIVPVAAKDRGADGGAALQILAGARRYRAAKAAGLAEVPVIVREMDDVAALELLVIDNDQREDVHPLEEAEGYRQLMERGKYDVARIAARIGRSVKYVYDRVKLLSLTKEAQEHFLAGKLTAGHAILLARLKPEDQKRAMVVDSGGVFEHERLIWDPTRDRTPGTAMRRDEAIKPVSVRELSSWIDKNVRFDAAAPDPMIFPETALTLTTSREEAEKIIPITYDHYVPPAAKDGTRTFGPQSWRRADGKGKSKTCDRAVTGVIVVGPGRGEAFKVCIDKEKCQVHWGAEHRAKKQRHAVASKSGKTGEDRWEIQRLKDEEERQRREAENARWEKARPAILEAVATRIKKLPAGANGVLGQILISEVSGYRGIKPEALADYLRGATAEDLVRKAVFLILWWELQEYNAPREFPKRAGAIGLNVKATVAAAAPEPAPEKPEKKASPAKARKGRAGSRAASATA